MPATKYASVSLWTAATLIVLLIVYSSNAHPVQAYQTRPQQTESDGLIRSVQGADLFRAHCASCHGVDGTGNGPASRALKKYPADLTRIAERNDGAFPEVRVGNIIAGDASISSHGSRDMPVWGPIFHQVEQDKDWGNVRLQNLVRHLKSIQRGSVPKK